jgi:hypothetical protein
MVYLLGAAGEIHHSKTMSHMDKLWYLAAQLAREL